MAPFCKPIYRTTLVSYKIYLNQEAAVSRWVHWSRSPKPPTGQPITFAQNHKSELFWMEEGGEMGIVAENQQPLDLDHASSENMAPPLLNSS